LSGSWLISDVSNVAAKLLRFRQPKKTFTVAVRKQREKEREREDGRRKEGGEREKRFASRALTGSPLMNQLSVACGFDLAEVQLNRTTSPT